MSQKFIAGLGNIYVNEALFLSKINPKVRSNKTPLKKIKLLISNIKKVLRLKKHNHTQVVKKFGKACSYPGTFVGSIHAMITSNNYKSAIIKTIKAGGCNCSRANFVGAYFAAYKGFKNIPSSWIKKTFPAKNVIKYI